jgi:heptosyltransferase-2
MNRILVIRGGAIGDFVLTLPAIKLLRDTWPDARLEILGYKHIIALAENRFYGHATRSIEYGPLASFFAKEADLPGELAEYFGSFDLIVSYLFDPDGVFEANLRRCGRARIVLGPAKLGPHALAAEQLASPMRSLGLCGEMPAAELFPNAEDYAAAHQLLPEDSKRLIAVHPGSGSATKNWPAWNWSVLGERLARGDPSIHLIVIGGEADAAVLDQLRGAWANLATTYIVDQPLTVVAAVIARCDVFIGHDSGISHIAAAVGTRSVLLFGPTDPEVWAPCGSHVRVISAASGTMTELKMDDVIDAIRSRATATPATQSS